MNWDKKLNIPAIVLAVSDDEEDSKGDKGTIASIVEKVNEVAVPPSSTLLETNSEISKSRKRSKVEKSDMQSGPAFEVKVGDVMEGGSVQPRTFTLFKSVMELTRPEHFELCQYFYGPAEASYFAKEDRWDKMRSLAADYNVGRSRLGSLMEDMLERDRIFEENQKRISDLEISLGEANKRAQDASLHLSTLEDRVKLLESEKSRLEMEKIQLEALRLEAEFETKAKVEALSQRETFLAQEMTNLEIRKMSLISRVQDKVMAIVSEREKVATEWGVSKFRMEFLSSSEGQEFLRILHRDLVANFSKSEDFADAIKGGISFLIGETIRIVLAQLGDPSLKEKIDLGGIVGQMRFDKLKNALGTDPQCPKEWWRSCIERAGRLLAFNKVSSSELPSIVHYDLPFLSESVAPTLTPLDEAQIREALPSIWEDELIVIKPASPKENALEKDGPREDDLAADGPKKDDDTAKNAPGEGGLDGV